MVRGALAIALVSGLTASGANPAMAQERAVWAGISALDFTYKEFDDTDGSILDREDGWIPGLVFGFREHRGPWFGHFDASLHYGEVDYDGHTQDGVPARTDTDERIVDASFRFGYWFGAEGEPRIAPYGGFGYRHWRRDIEDGQDVNGRPVRGILEKYRWAYLLVGVEANLRQSEVSEWGVDLRLTRPLDPKLDIEGFAGLDDATLELGEKTGGRATLYWRYWYGEDAAVELAPFYERLDIGRSPDTLLTSGGTPATVAFEPRSETRNYGVNLSIKRSF